MGRYEDISGRGPKSMQLFVMGIAGAVVLTVITLVFSMYARGQFVSTFALRIESEQLGEGIVAGSDVKLNGLRIGQVTRVESVGTGNQELDIAIDLGQADALTDNLAARFVSSNTLGMSSIELYPGPGQGAKLANNSTIRLGKDSRTVTVTAVLRKLTSTIGEVNGDSVGTVTSVFKDNSAGIANMIKTLIDVGSLTVDGEMVVGLDPRPAIGMLNDVSGSVARDVTGLADGLRENRSKLHFFVEHPDETAALINALALGFGGIGNLLKVRERDLIKLVDALLSFGIPIGTGIHGITDFYNRVPELIDRVDRSFVNQGGTTSLQLQVILRGMPYLAGEPVPASTGGGR